MGSTVLPDVTTPAPAYAIPERRANTHQRQPRERFAPLWLRAGLILATLAALAFLYPKSYIDASLRRQVRPNAATLAYLRLMVRAQPAADTRILLAQQALAAGDIALSRYALSPWLDRAIPALPLSIALLRLRLLRSQLDAAQSSPTRHTKLARAYARAVLLLAPRMDTSELLRATRIVAALGRYRTAARLYRHVIAQAEGAALRSEAFHDGIDALLAAGRPVDALRFAQEELAVVPPSARLWRQMTRLALMAEAPKLATRYARRLIGLNPP